MLGQDRELGRRQAEWRARLTTSLTTDNGNSNTDQAVVYPAGPRTVTGADVLDTAPMHIVVTHDGVHAAVYINGQLSGALQPWAGDCRVPGVRANHRLVLGNEVTGTRPWFGAIYLFAVYNYALTQEQIDQNVVAGP
jgi:hypothetical protein